MENIGKNQVAFIVVLFGGLIAYIFGFYYICNWALHGLMASIGNPLLKEYYSFTSIIKGLSYLVHNQNLNWIQIIWFMLIPMAEILFITVLYLFIVITIYSKFWGTKAKHNGDTSANAVWAEWSEIRKTKLIDNDGHGSVLGAYETPMRQTLNKYLGDKLFKSLDDKCDKYFKLRPGLKILIETSFNEHILGYAPSRSGKGVGLVIPTLLTWRDSIIILDPKGELYESTSGYARTLGYNVINLDMGTPHDCYNPFDELDPSDEKLFDQVDEIVNILLEAAKTTGDNAVFTRNAVTLLRGIILYKIKSEGKLTLSELAYAVAGYNPTTGESFDMTALLAKMKDYPDSIIRAVGSRFHKQAEVKDNKTFQSFLVEIEKNLAIFMSPSLAQITGKSDFIMRDIVDINKSPTALYMRIPSVDALTGRINTVSKLLLHNLFVNVIYKTGLREKVKGRWNKRCVQAMMDEFPSIGKFDIMEKLLADAGGFGLKLYLIAQSDKQINDIYGENNSIFDGCTHKVIFAPNEIKTAEVIGRHLGKYWEYEKHESTSVSKTGKFGKANHSVSTSYQRVEKDLLTAAEIFRLPSKSSIILTQTEKGKIYIYGTKFKYFENTTFLARVNFSKDYVKGIIEKDHSLEEAYNTLSEPEKEVSTKLTPELRTQIEIKAANQAPDWLTKLEQALHIA